MIIIINTSTKYWFKRKVETNMEPGTEFIFDDTQFNRDLFKDIKGIKSLNENKQLSIFFPKRYFGYSLFIKNMEDILNKNSIKYSKINF